MGAPADGMVQAPQKTTKGNKNKPKTNFLGKCIGLILCKALYKYFKLGYIIYINAGDV